MWSVWNVLPRFRNFWNSTENGCLKGGHLKADPKGVLTGAHFLDGDHACCEGAISAGCRFVAGYPITPSTEIVERIALRFPPIGGMFIQMEDEIASSIAIQGAVWAGAKAMTVTSGPGFSLMMEHIGLAAMTETPCVFVDVQRAGPSTGQPTLPGQADMMQARWGSHGDYEIIAFSPNSPQECYDLTIRAFNMAEEYRVPVMMMMDECVGHMTEKVTIPEPEEIEITERRYTDTKPGEYLPYFTNGEMVPLMAKAGDGHRFHLTGLTHDERGYPAMNPAAQEKCVRRLVDKIRTNAEKIITVEETDIHGADIIVVSYGITSRVAIKAIEMAKAKGIKVGHLRLITVWPFPEKRIHELAARTKVFIMPELNYGQMFYEMQRAIDGRAKSYLIPHGGGTVHEPEVIYRKIRDAAKHLASVKEGR
jgi:2-oxoglutarate/2-oxoacid ferredoxin oxidoreductase subunit alpha